jgi:serine/threonine protein phosphatase 1
MRWIIGDIHGMLRPLVTLVTQVRRVDPKSQLLFVGDYVNRGPNSHGVIQFLLGLDNCRFIRGNHDDIFDLVVNGHCYAENAAGEDRVAASHWFMQYGLDATLLSYGCDYAKLEQLSGGCTVADLDHLVECVAVEHRQFIRNLPGVYEMDDLFVVHGKWDPDELAEEPGIAERIEQQPKLRHRLLWGRFSETEVGRTKAWRRTGYFGHTPVSYYAASSPLVPVGGMQMVPVSGTKMVLVDTAAALGEAGRLSAFCADDGALVQADHFGNLVSPP